MAETTYAEGVNYWKTSRSSPDAWMERARRQIEKLGGEVVAEGFGCEPLSGRAAYLLAFTIGGDSYKVTWPVLASKTGDEKAARVQAATWSAGTATPPGNGFCKVHLLHQRRVRPGADGLTIPQERQWCKGFISFLA